jgi:HSP20 family molecular chaperone IbpA
MVLLIRFAGMKTVSIIKTEDHAIVRTFCGSFSDMDHLHEELHAECSPLVRPAINIAETPTEYMLELALPGYHKSDLHLDIEDDILIIRGTASCVPEHYEDVQRFYKKEFCVESFTRTFLLPEDVSSALAYLAEGILFIHLTKGPARMLVNGGPCYKESIPIT